MKHVVSIEVQKTSRIGGRMKLEVNYETRGLVDLLDDADCPVVPALLMLGFNSVNFVDESGREALFTSSDLLRNTPVLFGKTQPRGHVQLRRRWSEPLEDYRLDVSHDDVALQSVDARMNLDTLRAILVQLGFTVGHIQVLAQAA